MPDRARARTDIEAAVQDFIARGETFTAAHVTMAVRANGVYAGTLGHERGVAPIVRDIYSGGDMDGYSQTMVRNTYFAYHPIGQDPSTVDLRIGGSAWLPRVDLANFRQGDTSGADGDAPPPTPSRGATPLSKDHYNGGRAAVDGDTVRVEYNSEGYAQLPRPMTTALGWDGGTGVVLEGQTLAGSCTVRAAADGEDPTARLQPSSGALRVRDRALMPYGVGLHNDVTVQLDLGNGTLILT